MDCVRSLDDAPVERGETVTRRQVIGEAVRSGARGEFGALIPVRPAVKEIKTCLRGHWLILDLYDKLAPFSQRYRLHGWLCEVCRGQEACEPDARRLAEWALLDVTVQHPPDAAPTGGLVLVAHPPAAGTLAGRIALHLDGTEVGSVTASPCGKCRTATLDYVHVAADYRRLGFGRTLVAAAVARAPSYRWTAPLPDGPVAQSFRARIAMRRAGPPCAHVGGAELRR
ncbi:N-acetyltransferase [Amycolatopsis eburnea]|uniref:N-acetyltransferase n=1 Tax=Amycolatopsis eburnea TaxID=2267691 RepID=A0A427T7J7_9PSEU|nr:N-acetyltransferase [Amycolatopsis eburnea]